MKLQGRVAIITGASSGVGYETARLLAREGASVAVAARRRDKLEWLVGEIAGEGGRWHFPPTSRCPHRSTGWSRAWLIFLAGSIFWSTALV